jgi:hypothetical protein
MGLGFLRRASTTAGTHDEKSHHDTIRENALLFIMVKIKATCSDDGKKNDTGWVHKKASTGCLT